MQKKHSKFKNTGIIFELLTRQLTSDILANVNVSKSKDLIFKYFKESNELGKEWQLYNFLINEQFLDDKKAERALNVVLKAREKLNSKALNQEKYELIKEIKQSYPIESFFKSSVKNYKLCASIYKVFENHVQSDKFNISEIVQAKDFLIENLVKIKPTESNKNEIMDEYKMLPEDVRLLAYKFLVENLNKKYDSFSNEQKILLREYINNLSNTNSISQLISKEKTKIREELSFRLDKIDSQVTKIKLTEVIHQLDKISLNKGVKDNHIMVLLLSYELLNELKRNVDIDNNVVK
jgi:hypothetical protein